MLKKLLALLFLGTLGCAASPESVYQASKDKVVRLGMIFEHKNKEGKLQRFKGVCSGTFIDDQGTVLTCAHCISDPEMTKLFVKLENGDVYNGVVTKIDTGVDLALVAIPIPYYSPHFNFGREVKQGEEVLSFGSPLGMSHSVSVGWVETLIIRESFYILHSAAILPGNSGGPLVDMKGRLVGINEAMLMLNFFSVAPGYYIAIDQTVIKDFLRLK